MKKKKTRTLSQICQQNDVDNESSLLTLRTNLLKFQKCVHNRVQTHGLLKLRKIFFF